MGRGQNRSAGYNHVLAALADAIHAGSSYKGKGKGKAGKDGGTKGQNPQWGGQDGRNCTNCGDYNFGFRTTCRQCGAWLPPPRTANPTEKGQKASGKAGGLGNWNGAGKGPAADNGHTPGANAGGAVPAAPAPKATTGGTEHEEVQDTAERVREIRGEEEKLRRSRSQYVDLYPRLVEAIDQELSKLAAEREKLQPLEVNLQAAAGRTANARAALSKAREKRNQAAKDLRDYMERYKAADKEVSEAEARLCAAEAAATAKRADAKSPTVQEAMEVLQQTAAAKCIDASVAAQVSAALQQIANIIGAITAPVAAAGTGNANGKGEGTEEQSQSQPQPQPAGGAADGSTGDNGGAHPVFAVCGSTQNKSRRTLSGQQHPAAHTGPGDPEQRQCGAAPAPVASQTELYAGGAVDGEVCMDGEQPSDDCNLLSQAAAVLGDSADD